MKRRIVSPDGTLNLAFGAISNAHEDTWAVASEWVRLRHHQVWSMSEAPDDLITVGVFISPRHDGQRPWDLMMYATAGDLELPPEDADELDRIFADALISEQEDADLVSAVRT